MQRFSCVSNGRFHGSANDLLWHTLNAALICDLTSAPRNERTKGSEKDREREEREIDRGNPQCTEDHSSNKPLLWSFSSLGLSFYVFLAVSHGLHFYIPLPFEHLRNASFEWNTVIYLLAPEIIKSNRGNWKVITAVVRFMSCNPPMSVRGPFRTRSHQTLLMLFWLVPNGYCKSHQRY